ncbi:unnamed protein product [Arctogadus glacialis]
MVALNPYYFVSSIVVAYQHASVKRCTYTFLDSKRIPDNLRIYDFAKVNTAKQIVKFRKTHETLANLMIFCANAFATYTMSQLFLSRCLH